MSTQATLSTSSAVAFKGGMFTLTTLQIFSSDLKEISDELDRKIEQAPNFFLYAPIILDLQRITKAEETFDLLALCHLLKAKKLIPVGLRGASRTLKEKAKEFDLAIFPEEKAQNKKTSEKEVAKPLAPEEPTPVASPTPTTTRFITQPVRSGQQIYAQGGDLIVLASVSHGAELLADGHIHVYGSLRGRALAGVQGFQDAMIFCRSLEAELISIAGQYRLSEDLKESCWKQSACIQLIQDRLHIRPV